MASPFARFAERWLQEELEAEARVQAEKDKILAREHDLERLAKEAHDEELGTCGGQRSEKKGGKGKRRGGRKSTRMQKELALTRL